MESKWISVKDRLPETNDEFLVFPPPDAEMHIITAEFQPWNKTWKQDRYTGWDWEDLVFEVEYWMPLPADPEEENG